MTCNDCICAEVCYYKSFNDVRTLQKRRNDVEKICKSFVHRDSLQKTHTVDAVEVVHGRWECEHETWGQLQCSVCKKQALLEQANGDVGKILLYVTSNYCPNCGAKMDKNENP